MKIPRADVPVGAVWQQGIGPNGAGAPPEALQLSAAPSVMTSNSQFKLGAELSILQWLGLTTSLAGTTKVNITDVQTLTVKDITALRVQPGNQVIYEAVKVGGFSVQTDSSSQAAMKAALEQRSLNVKAETGNSLVVSGSNLYVAYRVITLNAPKIISRKKQELRYEREFQLGSYRLNFRTGGFLNCICSEVDKIDDHSRLHDCEKSNPVLMIAESETRSPAIGEMMRKQVRLQLHNDGIPPGPVVLFTASGSGFIEVDRINVRAAVQMPVGTQKLPSGGTGCLMLTDHRFKEGSEVELVTIRYPFKPFDKPSAGGW